MSFAVVMGLDSPGKNEWIIYQLWRITKDCNKQAGHDERILFVVLNMIIFTVEGLPL
jgi:hypothetical protein